MTSLALSPDGKRLFSGSSDTTIKVWDLEAGKEIRTLHGHTDLREPPGVVVRRQAALFGKCGQETIKVWDLEAGKETLTLRGHTRCGEQPGVVARRQAALFGMLLTGRSRCGTWRRARKPSPCAGMRVK